MCIRDSDMPYNFQGAGGIVNTGPIEDLYYLDSEFNVTLVPTIPVMRLQGST